MSIGIIGGQKEEICTLYNKITDEAFGCVFYGWSEDVEEFINWMSEHDLSIMPTWMMITYKTEYNELFNTKL